MAAFDIPYPIIPENKQIMNGSMVYVKKGRVMIKAASRGEIRAKGRERKEKRPGVGEKAACAPVRTNRPPSFKWWDARCAAAEVGNKKGFHAFVLGNN